MIFPLLSLTHSRVVDLDAQDFDTAVVLPKFLSTFQGRPRIGAVANVHIESTVPSTIYVMNALMGMKGHTIFG
jgi:hypothetical protein